MYLQRKKQSDNPVIIWSFPSWRVLSSETNANNGWLDRGYILLQNDSLGYLILPIFYIITNQIVISVPKKYTWAYWHHLCVNSGSKTFFTIPRIFSIIFLALPKGVQPSNLFALPVLLLFLESIIADLISRCLECCLHAGDHEHAQILIYYLSCPHFYIGSFA